jgi:hypothetical protein
MHLLDRHRTFVLSARHPTILSEFDQVLHHRPLQTIPSMPATTSSPPNRAYQQHESNTRTDRIRSRLFTKRLKVLLKELRASRLTLDLRANCCKQLAQRLEARLLVFLVQAHNTAVHDIHTQHGLLIQFSDKLDICTQSVLEICTDDRQCSVLTMHTAHCTTYFQDIVA